MKLIVTNKALSLGQGSSVKDTDGKDVYKVKGKVFSVTKKKKIYDLDGNLLFIVRNKWFNFLHHSAFIYNAEGEQVAKVFAKNFKFEKRFYVDGYSEPITIDGKLFKLGYTVNMNEKPVATITGKFRVFALGDQFEIETENTELMPMLVALTIAMDNISDNRQKED